MADRDTDNESDDDNKDQSTHGHSAPIRFITAV
jgi:hypothetical protein